MLCSYPLLIQNVDDRDGNPAHPFQDPFTLTDCPFLDIPPVPDYLMPFICKIICLNAMRRDFLQLVRSRRRTT